MSTIDEAREELIRSRGFIRAADTQLTKALDALDAITTEPAPVPEEPTPADLPEISVLDFTGSSEGWLLENVSINSGIGRITYPAGFVGGYAPGYASYESMPRDVRRVRVEALTRLSGNFQGHPIASKWGMIFTGGNGWATPKVVMQMVGADADPIRPTIWLQGVPMEDTAEVRNLLQNVAPHQIVRGKWFSWAVEVIQNVGDRADGVVRWWLDGKLIGNYTNVQFTTTEEKKAWPIVAWRPVWGGQGGTVQQEQWIECDEIRVLGA